MRSQILTNWKELNIKELKIHGDLYRRRTDIVGFVNGMGWKEADQCFRKSFGFVGTPIRFILREKQKDN